MTWSPILKNSRNPALKPNQGSVLGGNLIKILGHGFNPDNIQPLINGNKCIVDRIFSISTEIVCEVPNNNGIEGVYSVQIIGFWDIETISAESGNYEYSESMTPSIESVLTNEVQSGDVIRFSGQMISVDTNSENSEFSISIEDLACPIIYDESLTASSISCIAPNLSGGRIDPSSIAFSSKLHGRGKINPDLNLNYAFEISSLSQSRFTLAGGNKVSIYGSGFSDLASVKICEEFVADTKVYNINKNEIEFIVPPVPIKNSQTSALSGLTHKCSLSVTNSNNQTQSWNNNFITYDSSITPIITSVSPTSGGTAGGTELTIRGTGFTRDMRVEIAGSICENPYVENYQNYQEIYCVTSAWIPNDGNARDSLVKVFNSYGDSQNENAKFHYIDRWSSYYTWGGEEPPRDDEFVIISHDQTVMLDTDTNNLKMLLIQGGTLIFDEEIEHIHLNAQNILITDGGKIQAGTLENPYKKKITITMHGHLRSLELPVYGTKTLGVRHGSLELHGAQKKPSWVLLKETALKGSSQIKLNIKVDNWNVGDRIVISTTGHLNSQNENEERMIQAIDESRTIITLDKSLDYTHLGHTETFPNGKTLEMRAEVGILTRNIKFQGSKSSEWDDKIPKCPGGFDNGEFATQTCFQGRFGEEIGHDEFGAAIMLHPKIPGTEEEPSLAVAKISHIEMNYVGQAYRLARYPFHLHITGNNPETFMMGSSIWKAFNRAYVIHHTDRTKFINNVVYDIMGGAIFIENGIEQLNEITYNLAIFIKSSQALLNDDITPATIWVTHPNNIVSHNNVGGSTHFGIWYRMHLHPDATSYTPNVCPQLAELGEFKNNTIHSVGWFGLWVFEDWFPYENGHNCQQKIVKPAVFENIRVWRTEKGVEFFKVGAMQAIDWIVAETRHVGMEFKEVRGVDWGEKGSMIRNSTVVARTSQYLDELINERAGIILPAGAGALVDGVDLIGWGLRNESHGVTGTHIICRFSKGSGGYEWRFQNIRWFNSPIRLSARWQNEFKIIDLDGSFTGPDQIDSSIRGASMSRANVELVTTVKGVTDNPRLRCQKQIGRLFSGGKEVGNIKDKKTISVSVCPPNTKMKRFAFNGLQPDFLGKKTIEIDMDGSTSKSSHYYRELDVENGDGYQMVIPTQNRYEMVIPDSEGIRNISYRVTLMDMNVGDYLIMSNKVPEKPDEVEVEGLAKEVLGPITSENNHNEWAYDYDRNVVEYMIKHEEALGLGLSLQEQESSTITRSRKQRSLTVPFGIQNHSIVNKRLKVFFKKCYWEGCQAPKTTNLWAKPPSERPNDALSTLDKSWSWVPGSENTEFGPMKRPNRNTNSLMTLENGDSLYIPNGDWVVLDEDLNIELDTIFISGGLEFGKISNLKVKKIIVQGGILIATPKRGMLRPINQPLSIEFTGRKTDKTIQLGDTSFGSNGIACLGVCEFLSEGPDVPWVKLDGDADVGSIVVKVTGSINWPIGGKILFTSTNMGGTQSEIRKIMKISDSGDSITIDQPLDHKHRGVAIDNNDALVGEVSLLSRPIKMFASEDSNLTGFGMQLFSGTIVMIKYGTDIPSRYEGTLNLENVEISNFGQIDHYLPEDNRGGIVIRKGKNEMNSKIEEYPQKITNTVLYNGYSSGIQIFSTDNFKITGSTIHRSAHGGIKIHKSKGSIIENNICSSHHHISVMNVLIRKQDLGIFDKKWPACFDIDTAGDGSNNTFINNRASGSGTIGIRHTGHSCSQDPGIFYEKNIARGSMINFQYRGNPQAQFPDNPNHTSCVTIQNIQAANAQAYNCQILLDGRGQVIVNNSTFSNSFLSNTNIFISGAAGKENKGTNNDVKFENTKFIGKTKDFNCQTELVDYEKDITYQSDFIWQFVPTSKYSFSGTSQGIQLAAELETPYHPSVWNEPAMGFPSFRGQTVYRNVVFKDIGESCHKGTKGRNKNTKPAQILSMDLQALNHGCVTIFDENIQFINANKNKDLLYFKTPRINLITPRFCVDMECDVWTTPLIIDLKGEVTGSDHGAIIPRRELGWDSRDAKHLSRGLGDYRIPKTALTDFQGNRLNINETMPNKGRIRNLNEDVCKFNPNFNAYTCTGENSYHYMHLIIENLDQDVFERRLSPLAIITNKGPNGFIDLYNGPARQAWGQRYGIFHTTVAADTVVDLNFMATPPKNLRLGLQGGDTGRKILLKIYNPVPQLLKVSRIDSKSNGKKKDLTPGGYSKDLKPLSGTTKDFTPTLSSKPGSNYQNKLQQTLYLVIDDNQVMYDITVTDQVLMSFGFPPVDLDEFFEENIVSNLANFFGIPENEIRLVNVIREDTPIDGRRESRIRTRRQDIGKAIGVDIEIMPNLTEEEGRAQHSKEQLSEKLSIITDTTSAGDNKILEQVFNNTKIIKPKITKLAPLIPDSSDKKAYTAFTDKIDDKLRSDGRVDLIENTAIHVVKGMELKWDDNNVNIVEERTKLKDYPTIRFFDEQGKLISNSPLVNPWLVEASISDSNVILNGTTIVPVLNGQAEFSDLSMYSNIKQEQDNQGYQIHFKLISPKILSQKIASLESKKFTLIDQKIYAAAKIFNFGLDNTENEILYEIDLIDQKNDILSDINWTGADWFVETSENFIGNDDSKTKLTFPKIGQAKVVFRKSTAPIKPNQYWFQKFTVTSSDKRKIEIIAEPVLINMKSKDKIKFKESKTFQIKFIDLALPNDLMTRENLVMDFHNMLSAEILPPETKNEKRFYFSDLEIYPGSIIIEGTVNAMTETDLNLGVQQILLKTEDEFTLQRITFKPLKHDVSNDSCNFGITNERILGVVSEKVECVTKDTFRVIPTIEISDKEMQYVDTNEDEIVTLGCFTVRLIHPEY